MDTSRFNEHSRQRAILNSASRNYLQQIQVPGLGCVHNHVTSPRKRIFTIVSRPTLSQVKGKTIRRILIFDNHPDTLRLILDSGIDPDSGDAASRRNNRLSGKTRVIILGGGFGGLYAALEFEKRNALPISQRCQPSNRRRRFFAFRMELAADFARMRSGKACRCRGSLFS